MLLHIDLYRLELIWEHFSLLLYVLDGFKYYSIVLLFLRIHIGPWAWAQAHWWTDGSDGRMDRTDGSDTWIGQTDRRMDSKNHGARFLQKQKPLRGVA
jgi:hypothetical protein